MSNLYFYFGYTLSPFFYDFIPILANCIFILGTGFRPKKGNFTREAIFILGTEKYILINTK